MDLFLAHSLALLWISVGTTRQLVAHPADRLLATTLLAWGNLTVTRLALVFMDRLGEPGWILGTSLALSGLLWWRCSQLVPAPTPPAATLPGPGVWPVLGVGLTLIPLAASRLVPGFLDQPGDPEVLTTTAWLLTGLGTYRLSRVCTLGANTALAFSWLGLVVGLVVAPLGLAARGMPSAAGIFVGLVFIREWQLGRQRRHALLGSLALIFVAGGLSGYLLPDLRWSGRVPPPTATAPPDPGHQRLFWQDVLNSPESGPVVTTGLRPAEGPYPLRALPRFRSVRQSSMRLNIPATAQLARLRIAFSVGLLQRDKTEILIQFNGHSVKHCRLTRQDGWIDDMIELIPQPGDNLLEFTDAPHQQELDWRGYLERYSDVMRHVVTHNIPLEEGALEHYRVSGRPEGRIMLTREIPPPIRGAYYFAFRQLQVEGTR